MKIVYICNEINLESGWGVLNYYTIINSSKNFSEVIVFTLENANNVCLQEYQNIKIYPILNSMTNRFYKILILYKDMMKIKNITNIREVDIVHVLVEPLLPLIVVFKQSKKFFGIVGTYSITLFKYGVNKYLYKKALEKVNTIVSISEYTKSKFINLYNHSIKVIPLGVNFNSFQLNECEMKKEKAFVFVGHIKPRKGLIYALKAFNINFQNDPSIKFYIVGAEISGAYAHMCIEYIKENKLTNAVKIIGKVDNLELISIYQKSICNVLTSVNDNEHFEGFGLIHLEANACGTPTIGSYKCGNEDAIKEGKTGYLCNQGDVFDISNKMKLILNDFESNDFDKWIQNCVSYAKENDWKYYFNKLNLEVYN